MTTTAISEEATEFVDILLSGSKSRLCAALDAPEVRAALKRDYEAIRFPDRDALLEQMAEALHTIEAISVCSPVIEKPATLVKMLSSINASARKARQSYQNMKEGRSNVTG
jgi:hypothetical protein